MTASDTVRLPPHNVDAEESLLGSPLIDPKVLDCLSFIHADHFFIVKNGWVWDALLKLHERHEPIDFVTVCNELEARGQLNEIGGPAYISHLINVVPTAIHAEGYARIVERAAWRRKLLGTASDFALLAYDETANPADIHGKLRNQVERLAPNSNGHEVFSTWAQMESLITPITWSWPGWLPDGLLTIVAGESGEGKSALMLRVAACILRGDGLPDGAPFVGQTGCVLWAEAESAQSVNYERAQKWGLPTDKILSPLDDPLSDVQLDNPTHQEAMTALAHHADVRLLVVDSFRGAHEGDENSSELVSILKFLAGLTRDSGKPMLLSHHLRKRSERDFSSEVTLERLRGSSVIAQFGRVIWALDRPDPASRERKRLSVIKNNLMRFAEPIGLTINDGGVMFGPAPQAPRTETKQDQAGDLLMSLLADGPMPAEEIQREVEQSGLSWHAAKRAKDDLGIVSIREKGRWVWSLPAHDG